MTFEINDSRILDFGRNCINDSFGVRSIFCLDKV